MSHDDDGRHVAATTRSTRPRIAVIGALLVVLAWLMVGAFGGQYSGRLSEVQKNDNASFLPKGAESTQVANALVGFQDTPQLPFLVVVEKRSGRLSAGDLASITRYADAVPGLALPGLGGGATLGSYIVQGGTVGVVPSQDGRAALVSVPVDAAKGTEPVNGTSPIYQAATALRDAGARDLAAGLTAYVGGPGGLIADFVTAFSGIDGILLGVALVVVFVILLVVYRSPLLPFVVLISATFGLALASLAVYPLAQAGHITLSGQSQGILFILVVGAATDYSLLLVSRFREELHDRAGSWPALKAAWRGTVEPIVASAATVVLSLLCLLLARLQSTAGLGPVGAFGILGALVAALTFLPALLLLAGRYVFWPFVPKVDHVHAQDKIGTRGVWGRVARMVGAHPRRTWVVTAGLLLVAVAFLPTFKASGVSTSDIFLTDVDSVTAQKVIDAHFPGGAGSPVQIIAPQDRAAAVVAALGKEPGVQDPYVGLTPDPSAPPKVVDGTVLVQATLTAAADSPQASDVVERMRTDLHRISPDVLVGGQTATNLDARQASSHDLRLLVPVILLVIFVVLALLLRSLVAPLLLVGANVLSLGATVGIAAVVFNHVLHFPGADPSIPLYGFVFLVALGIDYSIFLMTRVREETLGRGTRQGILVGLAVTGGVITSAGIVLASTFSALVVLPIIFLVQVAFIVAFGVLLDTLVVRSLLVPSVAYDLGARIWWPSRLAREGSTAAQDAPVG